MWKSAGWDGEGEKPAMTSAALSDMLLLLCGTAYAVKHNPHRNDPDVATRYLDALLDGVLRSR